MTRLLPAVASVGLLAGVLLAADPAPPPAGAGRVAELIARLGDPDFARREAAEQELNAIGEPALAALQAAGRSANPEVARRAHDVAARVARQVGNEKALAPTLVQLDAENVPVARLLAQLSDQSGYTVTLRGGAEDQSGQLKVTVKTGKVPFWEAVLRLCDVAALQIASVGGIAAPGAGSPEGPNPFDRMPPGSRPRPRRPIGPAQNPNAITLEPRGAGKKRPAAVHGAVCVEAFPIPTVAAVPDTAAVLLQVWIEPHTPWQTTTGVRVVRAVDDHGQPLAERLDGPTHPPQIGPGNGVVVVRNVRGGVVMVNQNAAVPTPAPPGFTPNGRQVVVGLKPGANPSAGLAELVGAVSGTVRSTAEPLVTLTELTPGRPAEGSHLKDADLKATLLREPNGEYTADVEVSYDPAAVTPATPNDLAAAGVPPPAGEVGGGMAVLFGVQVTDADGKVFLLSSVTNRPRIDPVVRRVRSSLQLTLRPTAKTQGPPARVAFWAASAKSVEVSFALKDVPVAGGKK
jgi:hypothetical protein